MSNTKGMIHIRRTTLILLLLFAGPVFSAGILWAGVSSYGVTLAAHEQRLDGHDKKIVKLESGLDWIQDNMVLIMQRLDIKPLPRKRFSDDNS